MFAMMILAKYEIFISLLLSCLEIMMMIMIVIIIWGQGRRLGESIGAATLLCYNTITLLVSV